jgi:hypothetical protein
MYIKKARIRPGLFSYFKNPSTLPSCDSTDQGNTASN